MTVVCPSAVAGLCIVHDRCACTGCGWPLCCCWPLCLHRLWLVSVLLLAPVCPSAVAGPSGLAGFVAVMSSRYFGPDFSNSPLPRSHCIPDWAKAEVVREGLRLHI